MIRIFKHIGWVVVISLIQFTGQAQGVTSPLAGVKSASLGGANGVFVKDASSAFFNPAVTSMLETNMATGGIGLTMSNSAFINPDIQKDQSNSTSPLLIPFHAYGVYKIDDEMTASLSINTPFGMGRKWESEWIGRYIVQEVRFQTLQIQPTFSYLIREDLAVGIGPIISRGSFSYKHLMDFQNIQNSFKGNAMGFGANIGVWGKINDITEYGVSFKTPIKYAFKNGKSTLSEVPTLLSSTINGTENVTSTFKTPYQLSLSMSNRVMEGIYITYQFDLDGWRVYKDLNFDFENEVIDDATFTKNFKNSFAFRIGGEYQFSDVIYFRGGFFYRETPVADEYLSPDFPDASTLGYTAGGSYTVADNISIDLALVYENQAKRTTVNQQHNLYGTYKTFNYTAVIGGNYTF